MGNRKSGFIYLLPVFLALYACTQGGKLLDRSAYMNWIEHHKETLTRSKQIRSVHFEAVYMPAEYLVLKDVGLDVSEAEFEDRKSHADGNLSFTFRIRYDNPAANPLSRSNYGTPAYDDALGYVMTAAQNDFKLILEGDTFSCTYYNYEPNYNLGPYETMVVEFEVSDAIRKNRLPSFTFLYQDRMNHAGPVYLTFAENELKSLPRTK